MDINKGFSRRKAKSGTLLATLILWRKRLLPKAVKKKMIKKITRIFITLAIVLHCAVASVYAQGADGVGRALRSGNAGDVIRFSGNTIDITINNSQATYSRTQGELVLRDFFSRNAVRDFEVEHTGTSGGNAAFTIGTLNTAFGKYRVYILMRQRDGGYSLAELRLQK